MVIRRYAFGWLAGLCALSFATGAQAQGVESEADIFKKSLQLEAAYKYQEAINALLPLKQKTPQDYLLNYRLGYLNYLTKNYENSRTHYQQAITSSPNSIEARNAILLPLLAQEKYADAEQIARQILQTDPKNYYGNLRLAFSLRMQSKFKPAEQINRAMLQLYPTDIKFLLEHALTLSGLGKVEESKKTFERVQFMDPENAVAKYWLAPLPPPAPAKTSFVPTEEQYLGPVIAPNRSSGRHPYFERMESHADKTLDHIFRR